MPHEPLSDVRIDEIINFDRPDEVTALADEVKRRRAKDLATDAAAADAGFQVLPDHRADPVVVIQHLGARLRAYAEHERSLQEYVTHHLQTIWKLNVDIAAAQQRIAKLEAPVPLILYCPLCHTRHIKRHRSERGAADALAGQPPTEANAEYQAGYVDAAKRAREIPGVKSATGRFDVSKSLDKRAGQASVEISGLSDDRELVRKLDAGVSRITEALGFAPGGADFDMMVDAIQRLRARERGERVADLRAPCPKCKATGVLVDDAGRLAHHAPPGRLDQPLCTYADAGPLWRACRTCKAKPGSNCNHPPGQPPTVGDYDAEFHEERCWRPLTPEECDRLQLPKVRRGVWYQWGDELRVIE